VRETGAVSEPHQAPEPVATPLRVPEPEPAAPLTLALLRRVDAVLALSRVSGNHAVGRALRRGWGADAPTPPPDDPLPRHGRCPPRLPGVVIDAATRAADAASGTLLRRARDRRSGPRRAVTPTRAAQDAIRRD
jgi:hypothetical protein